MSSCLPSNVYLDLSKKSFSSIILVESNLKNVIEENKLIIKALKIPFLCFSLNMFITLFLISDCLFNPATNLFEKFVLLFIEFTIVRSYSCFCCTVQFFKTLSSQ
ncbi:hypothetical protein QG3_0206 [Clostridioides difficile CD169]|nr:hypothetical protein QG3_0206 [Clostridioides difficile CD169]EQG50421.1 hypothetical protein QIW_0212 [Clostridioides difficile DA00134]EQH31405.1 hypothetical protein QM3_0201 [Clostridioides difficile DA00215]EQI76088.1 hypothetical protein QQE_0198 [Clostridioides difficile Y381]EQK06280.1 hypothetical protein QUK_0205 [Clostridioides difficile P61]